MSAPQSPEGPSAPGQKPWLGQAVVLLVFFAVLGIGVVVALYDKGFLPIAGIFVAMIVGPLIVYFRRRWLAARHGTLVESLHHQLGDLVDDTADSPDSAPPLPRVAELAGSARGLLARGDVAGAMTQVDLMVDAAAGTGTATGSGAAIPEIVATVERLRRTRERIHATR